MYTLSVLSGQSPLEILIPEMLYNLTLPILVPKHNIRKSDSVESVILHEAMNNGLPIISAKNGMLFDLLVNDKTATIVDNFDSLYNAVVNINKNEVILDNAKELTNTFDYEKKGQALKEMYEKIIEESN